MPSGPFDRLVMAKHFEVYPSPEELEAVQTIVSHVECALKTVSDQMDGPKECTESTEADRYTNGLRRFSNEKCFSHLVQYIMLFFICNND